MTSTTSELTERKSRATTRTVEAGSLNLCAHCDTLLRFRARQKDTQIICNVYVDGMWDRVEHFHPDCYAEANHPHGPCDDRTKRLPLDPRAMSGPSTVND